MSEAKSSPFDNAGPAIAGIAKDFEPQTMAEAIGAALQDQAAYDRLGPLTRKAMKESPIRWSAAKCYGYAVQQSRTFSISPQVDAQMARMIRSAEPGIIQKIRVSDERVLGQFDPKDAINRIIDRAMARSKRGG